MKLPRRKLLHLAMGTAALSVLPRSALALDYPTRAVHVIVPFPAGQAADSIARLMGQSLSERLGQQFVVENRPGAGGTIGTEVVVRASPDGYTLLMGVVTSDAINAALYTNLNYNFIRDITPVASIGGVTYVMVINPSVPARTVPEFIAYAKANPGKINMGSAGIGTPPHVFGELFKMMAGVDIVHVPYRGSYLPDLLGGQVQIVFSPMPTSIAYIRADKLRALAVTATTRSEVLPDIPTVAEFIPGYEASAWQGFGAPRDLPADIVNKLNDEINATLVDPKTKTRFADLGVVPMPMTPTDFKKLISSEVEKWAKVIRAANIQPG